MASFVSGRSARRGAAGFSLIEVLVVVAVVSMLSALTVPALRGARDAARGTVCAARMSQAATLLRMYTTDHRDRFPRVQDASYGVARPSFDPAIELEKTWVDLMVNTGYLDGALELTGVPSSLLCPSARGYDNDPTWAGHMPHFGVNMHLNPSKKQEASAGRRSFFGRPYVYEGDASRKIMMADSRHLTNARGWFGMGNANWVGSRHVGGAANVAYLDGHVASRRTPAAGVAADDLSPFAGVHFWRQRER